jgi:type II secretory pathway pseudopilin PulG
MVTRSTSQNPRCAIAPKLGLYLSAKLVQSRREEGLTLIEGLIAIVIVSITVVMITPPIFWATASRVQTRRAEQALQIAQGEVERVRSLVERGTIQQLSATAALEQLPPTQAGLDEEEVRQAGQVLAPKAAKTGLVTSLKNCTSTTINTGSTNEYAQVKIDTDASADCEPNFLVQVFRSQGLDRDGNPVAAGQVPTAFVMGVRVYAAVAKDELTAGRGKEQQASLKGTSGLGQQKNFPLAVFYSTIVPSSQSGNLDLYRKLCVPSSSDLTAARKC